MSLATIASGMMMTTTDGGGRFYLIARTGKEETFDLERHDVYAIDDEKCPRAVTLESVAISPIKRMSNAFRRGCERMICCEGSHILVPGGLTYGRHEIPFYEVLHASHMSQDVWYIDVEINEEDKDGGLSSKNLWKQGPSMRSRRCEGCATSYDGKVYVFGGLNGMPGECNEVYDIGHRLWYPMDFPASVDGAVTARRRVDAKGQPDPSILLISSFEGLLRQYHISTGLVSELDRHFKFYGMPWIHDFEVSGDKDNILVTYLDTDCLFGYNLDTNKISKIGGLDGKLVFPPVDAHTYCQNVYKSRPTHQQMHLFSIGKNGKLCVIWGMRFGFGYGDPDTIYSFYYTKFTVKVAPDGALFAETEDVRSFHIHGALELISCLTVDSDTPGSQQSAKRIEAGEQAVEPDPKRIKLGVEADFHVGTGSEEDKA